jgi:hypothetical protein
MWAYSVGHPENASDVGDRENVAVDHMLDNCATGALICINSINPTHI